jgi:hypothetical protein
VPNAFSKQETAMFDDVLEGFSDAMVMSKNVTVNSSEGDPQTVERSQGGAIWRPMPYIATVYNGVDQTSNFKDYTQLMVPATVGFQKSVPVQFSAADARDLDYQMKNVTRAAIQGLGSAVNASVLQNVLAEGSLFVKRSAAASGYDDLSAADALMNETGVPMGDRVIALNTRDYNAMAGNLAARQTFQGDVSKAYRDAMIGEGIAGFDAFKMDTGLRLALAVPGAGVTINGANQRYVPKATSTAGSGEVSLVDNRAQVLTVTVGAGGALKAGDKFTIPGVNAVHPITKADTGQLKTFTIKAILTGGGTAGTNTMQISPPIVAADSTPTAAESQYKNVTATPANGATLTFLNTATTGINPFWRKDSIELIPSRPGRNPGGLEFLQSSTDQGITIQMTRQGAINDLSGKYRWDCWYGVVNLNPEMNGLMMFAQP